MLYIPQERKTGISMILQYGKFSSYAKACLFFAGISCYFLFVTSFTLSSLSLPLFL